MNTMDTTMTTPTPLKIYRVTLTRSVEAHVIAESAADARDLAEDDARDWFDDGTPTVEAAAREVPRGWEEHELPYLTDAAHEHATAAGMSLDSTVEQWAAALRE